MRGLSKDAKPQVDFLTVSEKGPVRKDNQDSFFVDGTGTVFCVADGMGGGAEGATASRFVCEEVAKAVGASGLKKRRKEMDRAIVAANDRIFSYAKERRYRQMGTTIALLLLDPKGGERAEIGHVGDSRIYRIRRGTAELLTKDHTIGAQLGELTTGSLSAKFMSRTNPLAHVLTRAIGVDEAVACEWHTTEAKRGDAFLVCSDGVHDLIADSLIGEIMSVGENLEAASKRLAEEIVRCGAHDNYTYLMIRRK